MSKCYEYLCEEESVFECGCGTKMCLTHCYIDIPTSICRKCRNPLCESCYNSPEILEECCDRCTDICDVDGCCSTTHIIDEEDGRRVCFDHAKTLN